MISSANSSMHECGRGAVVVVVIVALCRRRLGDPAKSDAHCFGVISHHLTTFNPTELYSLSARCACISQPRARATRVYLAWRCRYTPHTTHSHTMPIAVPLSSYEHVPETKAALDWADRECASLPKAGPRGALHVTSLTPSPHDRPVPI